MVLPATTQVLIVEDDDVIRNMLLRAFERHGIQADAARDGVEALEMLRRKPFAVVIVDLMMPRMSGFELLIAMRAELLRPLPIVFVMTAYDDAVVRNLESDIVAGIIHKPFDLEHLIALVRDCAHAWSHAAAAPAELSLPQVKPIRDSIC
jgi:CheY-like chemotaxis protein